MPSIIIDGKKIELKQEQPQNILQVALENGIYIPNLCYHKKLLRYGACRLCLVEIQGVPRLAASCATSAVDKMVVTTNSAQLQKLRRTVLELQLVHHPLDCWVCDKGGECELQNVCYYLGIDSKRLPSLAKPYPRPVTKTLIERDMHKCVLCGKCVRFCNEVVGNGAIGYVHRGFQTEVGYPFNQEISSDCAMCGRCIDVCPVGALTSPLSEFVARPWEVKDTQSICPYCGVGCSITLRVKDGKVVKVKGEEERGTNEGQLCVRGHYGYGFVNHQDRLLEPVIKINGVLDPVSWDTALAEAAFRLKKIIKTHGPDAIGVLGSARSTNEESYLLQKFARGVIGTNNIDYNDRLSQTTSVEALSEALGYGAMTNTYEEIMRANVILNFGLDVTQTHPVLGSKIFEGVTKHEAALITINPLKTKDVVWAKGWAAIKPGTEIALINGLISELLNQDLIDKSFIEQRTMGFEKIKEAASAMTKETAAAICGVEAQTIAEIARLYGQAKTAVILYGDQVIQTMQGKDTVLALLNLAAVAGKLGKAGCGINGMRDRNNSQGASDMGLLPNYLPGYQRVDDALARKALAKKWQLTLPEKPGLTFVEMIEAAQTGKIKGMIILGENPLNGLPESKKVREALRNLELLVVIDIFLTDTARLADIVLPAASFAEKEGTVTNSERRVQRLRVAVPRIGNSKPDREIIIELAGKMGVDLGSKDAEKIMQQITDCVEIYQDISYAGIGENGQFWGGASALYQNGFPKGKVVLRPVSYVPPAKVEAKYKYTLMTTAQLYHSVSGTMSRRAEGLVKNAGPERLDISEVDAERLLLKDESKVLVVSRHGEMVMPIRINKNVPEGVVVASVYSGPQISVLFSLANIDPLTKSPAFQLEKVALEKTGS